MVYIFLRSVSGAQAVKHGIFCQVVNWKKKEKYMFTS